MAICVRLNEGWSSETLSPLFDDHCTYICMYEMELCILSTMSMNGYNCIECEHANRAPDYRVE